MEDKKAVSITNDARQQLDKFVSELEAHRPIHEIDGLRLDNEKKRIEIDLLYKQMRDYKITRLAAWIGAIGGGISIAVIILKVFGIIPQ